MKSATAFLSNKEIIIHPDSLTTAGVGLATEPYIKLTTPASDHDLFLAIKEALNSVKTGIPHPTDWKKVAADYEKNIGYNNKKIHKNFTHCGIQEDENNYYFTPSENLGAKNGYTYIVDKKITVNKASSEKDIAEAFYKTMKECTVSQE